MTESGRMTLAVTKVAAAALLAVVSPVAGAGEIAIEALVGDQWYGLYMNGQKMGYSKSGLSLAEDGSVTITEDAVFKLAMVGRKQDMRIRSVRVYDPDGALSRVESHVEDMAEGTNVFSAVVVGQVLRVTSKVGGYEKTFDAPRPKETLSDMLSQANLVSGSPSIGDSITFNLFEPTYQREIEGRSEILGAEERILDGVATTVYKIRTVMVTLGIESLAYVTAEGMILEDQLAGGILTMRLEPEKAAKDTGYANDVIVSNAAKVKAPIDNPRTRARLTLKVSGPLQESHLINDARQSLTRAGDHFVFVGKKLLRNTLSSATLPIEDAALAQWRKPSLFVQSDHPRLVAKAKEIVGDESDAFTISTALLRWVYTNMRTTFSARLTNSLEVLDSMEGDCTEHSMLFIGLARAAGLPAREAAGLIYVSTPEPGFYFHQWAMVWVGQWIDVDPTFNQPIADTTHIKLAEGDLLEQLHILPVIGQIAIEAMADAQGP